MESSGPDKYKYLIYQKQCLKGKVVKAKNEIL